MFPWLGSERARQVITFRIKLFMSHVFWRQRDIMSGLVCSTTKAGVAQEVNAAPAPPPPSSSPPAFCRDWLLCVYCTYIASRAQFLPSAFEHLVCWFVMVLQVLYPRYSSLYAVKFARDLCQFE